MKLEYFLNKLYVAVSRSTQYLTIVDTEIGDRFFWQAASKKGVPSWLESLEKKHKLDKVSLEKWDKNLEPLYAPVNLKKGRQVDFYGRAKTWMTSGLNNSDVEHLRTAIYLYEKVEAEAEIRYCEAWILRLEGKLQDAGKLLMELGNLAASEHNPKDEAWSCFWEGKFWNNLETWLSENPDAKQSYWQPVVQFMLKVGSKKALSIPTKLIGEFSTFLCQAEDNFWQKNRHDSTLRTILECYQKIVSAHVNDPKQLKPEYWKTWSNALQKLAAAGFNPDRMYELAGHCLYHAKEFEAAIHQWDEQGQTGHVEYSIAKAEITPAPDNISWFNQAELFDRILQVWQEHQSPITDNWEVVLSAVRDALNHERRYVELLDLEIRTHQWAEAARLCKEHRYKMKDRERIIHGMAEDIRFTAESSERSFLSEFMDSTLDLPAWKPNDQKVREACIVLERIGEFRVALPIFEQFFEDDQLSARTQRFARERWLVMKGKQADFLDTRNLQDEAKRARGDRRWKAQEWGINLRNLSKDVPVLEDPLIESIPFQETERVVTVSEATSTICSPERKDTPVETEQLREEIVKLLEEFNPTELKRIKHYQNYLLYLKQDEQN